MQLKNDKADGNGLTRDSNVIPNTYRFGLKYNEGKWDANMWLRYGTGANDAQSLVTYYPGESYEYSEVVGRYIDDKYFTVDLAVTYKATKDLSVYAKAYNIFNEAYAEHAGTTNGSYNYPAQSRRFIVGAEYKF